MIVITMVILKEIVFTSLIYTKNVYHQSERDILFFAWFDSWCDLGKGMTTWFQVLVQLVLHNYLFGVDILFVLYKPVWVVIFHEMFWY